MPHSSGGGSSRSGSHSGSSYHSSSHYSSGGGSSYSGSRGPSLYDSYSPGQHVFVRYENGYPRFYYSNYSYRRTTMGNIVGKIFACIFLGIFLIAGLYLLKCGFAAPKKITHGETPCVIEDYADVFPDGDEQKMKTAAADYYKKTGIPVVIQSITKDMFRDADKDSLETYAYYAYVNEFSDENHWLIVFEDIDRAGRSWEFEGMQGDNTDPWLTTNLADGFNEDLTERLWNKKKSYGLAIAESLEELSKKHAPIDWEDVVPGLIFIALSLPFILIILLRKSENQQALRDYHEVHIPAADRKSGPRLVECSYCGGTYVFGETQCPHCGAPGKTTEEYCDY